jgi:hypothetical protein
MKQKARDRLLDDLLVVRSRLDDAYNMDPIDEEWVKYLQELQSRIYKVLSTTAKVEEK